MIPVIIDTETTGLGHAASPPRNDGIIQVGYAYRRRDGVVEEWQADCNPGAEYAANGRADGAFRVNGFTQARVACATPAASVAMALRHRLEAIELEHGDGVLLHAFNAEFDRGFLDPDPWWLSEPKWTWGDCIMWKAAARINDGQYPIKLETAVNYFRINRNGHRKPHTAASDAHDALLVLEALR